MIEKPALSRLGFVLPNHPPGFVLQMRPEFVLPKWCLGSFCHFTFCISQKRRCVLASEGAYRELPPRERAALVAVRRARRRIGSRPASTAAISSALRRRTRARSTCASAIRAAAAWRASLAPSPAMARASAATSGAGRGRRAPAGSARGGARCAPPWPCLARARAGAATDAGATAPRQSPARPACGDAPGHAPRGRGATSSNSPSAIIAARSDCSRSRAASEAR